MSPAGILDRHPRPIARRSSTAILDRHPRPIARRSSTVTLDDPPTHRSTPILDGPTLDLLDGPIRAEDVAQEPREPTALMSP